MNPFCWYEGHFVLYFFSIYRAWLAFGPTCCYGVKAFPKLSYEPQSEEYKHVDQGFGLLQPPEWQIECMKPLRLGTDFSGLDAIACALLVLGVPVLYLFATESNSAAQTFLRLNHAPVTLFHDVKDRPIDTAWDLDLYAAGPPCQPFSPNGKRLGLADPRSKLFEASIAFICGSKPKMFLLENSHLMPIVSRGQFFRGLLRRLRASGYRVRWSTLNALDHGIPQYRERTFVIGYRSDIIFVDPVFPTPLPCLTLEEILMSRNVVDDPRVLPVLPHMVAVISNARVQLCILQNN